MFKSVCLHRHPGQIHYLGELSFRLERRRQRRRRKWILKITPFTQEGDNKKPRDFPRATLGSGQGRTKGEQALARV